MRVKLSEAAWLVGRHERIVRWHLLERHDLPAHKDDAGVWWIETNDLERIGGWHVDPERLRELEEREKASAPGIVSRLEALEREVATLRARLRDSALARYDGQQAASTAVEVSAPYRPSVAPLTPSYAILHTTTSTDGTLRTHADAARWLVLHGVNSDLTPKSWTDKVTGQKWRDVPLDRRAVLLFAIGQADGDHRRGGWRLHRCSDSTCVFHDVLGE